MLASAPPRRRQTYVKGGRLKTGSLYSTALSLFRTLVMPASVPPRRRQITAREQQRSRQSGDAAHRHIHA
jgi:hypothetical protein